jgi:hypothetical protein
MNSARTPLPWYFTPTLIIVSGCLVAMVYFGVRSSFGLFTAPISETHLWPRVLMTDADFYAVGTFIMAHIAGCFALADAKIASYTGLQ